MHFKQVCKERTAAREAAAQVQAVAIEIHPQQRIDKRTVARKSIGSAVLLAVYNALGVETVIRNATRGSGADYDANAVMRLLAVERILDLEGNWWRFDHRTDASDDLCRMAGVDLTRQNMQLKDIKAVLSQAKLQIPSPNKKCKQKEARFLRSGCESEPLQLQKSGQRICEWLCHNARLILLTDDQPWNRNNRCSRVVANSIM